MSLYAKRLERGRFIWPSATEGIASISTRNLLTCWMESIGEIRSTRGGRLQPDEC